MTKRSKVELFEQIRGTRRFEPDVSVRELARRFETHRRTVREALASAVPALRKPAERASPVLDEWERDRAARECEAQERDDLGGWCARRCRR